MNIRIASFMCATCLILLVGLLSWIVKISPTEVPNGPEIPDRTSQFYIDDTGVDYEALEAKDQGNLGGYASRLSVTPGETLDFHISTNITTTFPISIYREGAVRKLMQTIEGVSAGEYDCTNDYSTGCNWPVAYTFTVPDTWPSATYTVDIPTNTTTILKMIFWVRESNPGSTARILLLSNVNTYNAYNNFGGKSLYGFNSSDNQSATAVSFDRPFQGGTGQFMRWERYFVGWAETYNYALAHATTYDLHMIPTLLDPYDVVIIAGHSEYWTWEMRQRVKQFTNSGGRLLNLSGNTMWWQVRYDNNGRIMVGYKNWVLDPQKSPQLTTDQSWDQPINDASFSITGTSWLFGGYPLGTHAEGYGGYWIMNANHWVFADTGLLENSVIGLTSKPSTVIHDKESDGMPLNCAADGRTILGSVGNTETPPTFTVLGIAPMDSHISNMTTFAVMGIYTLDGGGAVFSANTTGWIRGLSDPAISRVTQNILDRFLSGDVPHEPVNPDSTYLFYDRFNCDNINDGRFAITSWSDTIHRYNYYKTVNTQGNRLSDACGVDGSGLEMQINSLYTGMAYQSMLKPNWGTVQNLYNRMYLNLSAIGLENGAQFDLIRYYNDNRINLPIPQASLQIRNQDGQLAMRFQPAGANLSWRAVPDDRTFLVETNWNQAENLVSITIDGVSYKELVNLTSAPALNRADLGLLGPQGSYDGTICVDELIFDDDNSPVVTPTPTSTVLATNTATPTATATSTITATMSSTATPTVLSTATTLPTTSPTSTPTVSPTPTATISPTPTATTSPTPAKHIIYLSVIQR